MKRARKILLIVCGVVVLLIVIGAIYIYRPLNDGRTPAERRQIVDACFAMLHSSLTNEVDDIKPDDPRVPEVIRALHPHCNCWQCCHSEISTGVCALNSRRGRI
jgi:hypothetical protein